MAIDNFIPEWWAAELLSALRARLVYAGPGIVNRNYEGLIENAGDTVRINTIADPSVTDYTQHSTTITYNALSDSEQSLSIDQAKYFAFKTEDIERAQALPGVVEEATRNAAYKMAETVDAFVSDLMYDTINQGANDLGAKTADISDNSMYGHLVSLRNTLTRDNVPTEGRWVVVPPEVYGALLQDNRFVDASASADGGNALRNGFVGRAAGFDVYESNTVPEPTPSTYAVIAGHPWATTFAEQINKVEAIRLEGSFSDGVRGLALYGGKVIRPTALAMASVTVQA